MTACAYLRNLGESLAKPLGIKCMRRERLPLYVLHTVSGSSRRLGLVGRSPNSGAITAEHRQCFFLSSLNPHPHVEMFSRGTDAEFLSKDAWVCPPRPHRPLTRYHRCFVLHCDIKLQCPAILPSSSTIGTANMNPRLLQASKYGWPLRLNRRS